MEPCIDYRGLNKITIRNRYPLPLMSSAFDLLQGASIFTKLDLRNAYHLVRIRRGDELKRPSTPRRGTMSIRHMINHFVFVYLDDILIFSSSLQEHRLHVGQVPPEPSICKNPEM